MKRLIVKALEDACGFVDGLPEWTWRIPGLHRLGCPNGMASWSDALDARWGTGVWEPIDGGKDGSRTG